MMGQLLTGSDGDPKRSIRVDFSLRCKDRKWGKWSLRLEERSDRTRERH